MFRDILDHLTSYRFKSDPYFLDQSYLAWKGLYTAKLKHIPSKWNLQYVKKTTFSEVQVISLEIDKMSEEIIDESREINFKYLHGKFIGLRELLWNILDMADREIVKLVDNISSQMGG